jgi:pimeloyl-ACP methyl ester carboxylesterase
VSVVDPEELYYYGNSQGGILGGAYTALSRDVIRGVLGVGGMPYSILLPRSVDFDPFFAIFRIHMADHRERMLFITGLVQQLWDMGEGAGYAHDMDKDVLLQVAINDHQVTTLGAHIQARAWGAATVAPETRTLWDIEEREPGFEGSALVEFLYNDIMDEPVGAHPPPNEPDLPRNGDPHECPRRDPAGQLQINDFLRLGVVNQYCDGICDALIAEDC